MGTFETDALSDKIEASMLCRILMRKGMLTYAEFEELVLRGYLVNLIETMPSEKLNAFAPKMFDIADPENKTKWRERYGHPKEAK